MDTVLHIHLTVPQPAKFPTFHKCSKQAATVLLPFTEYTTRAHPVPKIRFNIILPSMPRYLVWFQIKISLNSLSHM
jgi:hypothetical protein